MINLLKEVAEPSKRQILIELRGGPKSVNELVEATGMKQPNVSNHLAKLRHKGIVNANKIGRQVYYSLSGPDVEATLAGMIDQPNPETAPKLNFDEVAKQYARAAIAGDENVCAKIIDQQIRQHVPLVRIYQQVLGEAMNYIGKWYEVAAIDVGQEHLASAITERMMGRVVHYAPPVRATTKTAVIGCVAGNYHSIGPRMISDYLRLCGWKAYYLGANTPAESFLSSVAEHHPKMVLLSVAFEEDRTTAKELIQQLKECQKGHTHFLIGVGGRQATLQPEEFIQAGADFTAASLMTFSEEILPRLEGGQLAHLGVFLNHKKLD